MLRLNDKWLPLLLALVLGSLPFARTLADTSMPAPPELVQKHHSLQHPATDSNNCDGCTTAHNCGTSSCSCYQCGTCSVTILHESLTVPYASLTPLVPAYTPSQLSNHPFLLFRPPRA